jgi:hypothetical protein
MSDKSIMGTIVNAEVINESSIILRILLDNNRYVSIIRTTEDPWFRIPSGRDPVTELREVCDLFNGFRIVDGEREPTLNFVQKRILIEAEPQDDEGVETIE